MFGFYFPIPEEGFDTLIKQCSKESMKIISNILAKFMTKFPLKDKMKCMDLLTQLIFMEDSQHLS